MDRTTYAVMGAVLGGVTGCVWHRLVGCSTGACPITANPFTSTLYGALIGLMIALN